MDFSLAQILADEKLSAELLRRLPAQPEGLESVPAPSAKDELRRRLEADASLEKIIRDDGRPALFVRQNTFDVPATDFWRQPLEAARPALEQAIRSVGRVELAHGLVGTAWVVGDGIVATNRHVAETFATTREGRAVFLADPDGSPVAAAIDFRHEHDVNESLVIQVEAILHIEPNVAGAPDLALLRLARHDRLPPPIDLHPQQVAAGQQVVVIGYPAFDPYEKPHLLTKFYQDVYNVKRLAPGFVVAGDQSTTFTHDCSTLGGNSGSVVLDLASGQAVGLHYAGVSGKANYAVHASVVATRVAALRGTPVAAAPPAAVPERAPVQPRVRPPEYFAGRKGYRESFLGAKHPVPLPKPGRKWQDDIEIPQGAQDGDGHLKYVHFTTLMSRSRKMALFTAVNIDGNKLRRLVRSKTDTWFLDGRISAQAQIGEELYGDNQLDRGHLVRRLDPVWGDDAELANEDTFHFTNACPQHQELNRKTWLALEDYLLESADVHDLKVSVFTGPVLSQRDRLYRHQARLPQRFWKVAVMVLQPEKRLSATAYLLSQRDLVDDLEFAFGAFRTYQVPIAYVEKITGLDFGELRQHDPLGTIESPNLRRDIESGSDLVLRPPTQPLPGWDTEIEALRMVLGDKDKKPSDIEAALQGLFKRLEAGDTMPLPAIKGAMVLLKNCRQFRAMIRLSDATQVNQTKEWLLRRLRAQALIDGDEIDAAIAELTAMQTQIEAELAATPAPSDLPMEAAVAAGERRVFLRHELAEVVGLLGRSYKQRCVDRRADGLSEARRQDARQSLEQYLKAYLAAPIENLWHGINYVAVAKYAATVLEMEAATPSPDEIAAKLLSTYDYLDSRGMITGWDYATRAEALLALGRETEAKAAYAKYVAHPDINDFMAASARRQLEQIWRLPADHDLMTVFAPFAPRPEIAEPPPTTSLHASNDSKLHAMDGQLQARYADAPFDPTDRDPMALSRARAVARLGADLYAGEGTGFMFDGALISEKLTGKPLLLTCAHVCPDAVKPEKLKTIFFGEGSKRDNVIVEFAELLWTSPTHELDASLLLLRAVPYGVIPAPLSPDPITVDEIAYIISHPLGGGPLASLRDNHIKKVGGEHFSYTSATDPGSSGGPVFDKEWRLTGIHRKGNPSTKLNEARRLDLVIERLRKHQW